jgi:hypothetical protein
MAPVPLSHIIAGAPFFSHAMHTRLASFMANSLAAGSLTMPPNVPTICQKFWYVPMVTFSCLSDIELVCTADPFPSFCAENRSLKSNFLFVPLSAEYSAFSSSVRSLRNFLGSMGPESPMTSVDVSPTCVSVIASASRSEQKLM